MSITQRAPSRMWSRTLSARTALACALSFFLAGCLDDQLAPSDEVDSKTAFIPQQRDFEDFRSWMDFPLEDSMHADTRGTVTVYANRLPKSGSEVFPVGMLIVKTTKDTKGKLTIHAMAKRGSDYNVKGALGWEYFELAINADDVPVIAWRGDAPPDGEHYQALPGGTTMETDCNGCHMSSENDAVLGDVLKLKDL